MMRRLVNTYWVVSQYRIGRITNTTTTNKADEPRDPGADRAQGITECVAEHPQQEEQDEQFHQQDQAGDQECAPVRAHLEHHGLAVGQQLLRVTHDGYRTRPEGARSESVASDPRRCMTSPAVSVREPTGSPVPVGRRHRRLRRCPRPLVPSGSDTRTGEPMVRAGRPVGIQQTRPRSAVARLTPQRVGRLQLGAAPPRAGRIGQPAPHAATARSRSSTGRSPRRPSR